MPYTFFDHTGDFGADLRGADQGEVLSAAVQAFCDLLTGDPSQVRLEVEQPLELEAGDAAELLVALGNELIYGFEAEGFLAADFEPEEVTPRSLRGLLVGEDYDPERHPIARPIKAVTHHQAACEPAAAGWRGRLIFDL
ncbi:MAG: archease [Planctomycetota bacterium]